MNMKKSSTTVFAGVARKLSLMVCMLCMAAFAYAQQRVTGTVTDAAGQPVIGASVIVEGTMTGTTTDVDGKYSIEVPAKGVLEFSYVGLKTQLVPVGNNLQVNVQMAEDAAMLDDVVVIGFGTVKKRDLTGSVASIKSEKIAQAPTSSVVTSLQGRIAGLDINGSTMRIRGNRSINGSNDPLVIIDGVQGGSISDINPADIESIDVLKDASSTAIYGSQGANGVIIITTKAAKAGEVSVNYDGYVTLGFRPERPEYRMGLNYYEARKLAAVNAGMWNSSADDQALFGTPESFAAFKAGQWTNYEDLLQKDVTISQRHTVSVSGGTDKTRARFSLGYAGNGSRWKESSGSKRFNLRANIDHKFYEWINAGVNFQVTHNRSEASPYQASSTSSLQLGKPYDSDGNIVTYPLSPSEYVNPLIDNAQGALYSAQSYSTNAVANAYIDLKPIKGLTIRSQLNAHLTNASSGSFKDATHSTEINATKKSTASETKSNGTYVEWNNIITYNFTIADDHNFGVTALTAWNKSMRDELSATDYDQLVASNLWWNLGSGDQASRGIGSLYVQTQNFSYAGRINYNYKGKYLFTASVRRDGASVLAKGNKWATFPSAAVAWRISDEGFMENSRNWLDDLKLRATYGVTGNSGIEPYGTQSGVTAANWQSAFQDTAVNRYIFNDILGNVDTKWEMSETLDFGIDATLFNGRINLVADYYVTNTSDLLLLRSLPTSAGNDGKFSLYQNIGETQNKGFELTLNTRNIVKKDFEWTSTLTFSTNKEKIVDLIEGQDIQLGNSRETETLMIGRPIHSIQAYKYQGIWKSSEAAEAALLFADANRTIPFKPGDIKVADVNDDGLILDTDDFTYLGSTSPKWFAGFNNDFRYKNFDLNIYMYVRWGHWGNSPMASFNPSTGGTYKNMTYWVEGKNENALFPALMQDKKFYEYYGYQGMNYCDQSFFKIKRITLGYTLPESISKKAHISKLRAYATVTDPFHWEKSDFMDGYDPEGLSRTVVIGLNLNF